MGFRALSSSTHRLPPFSLPYAIRLFLQWSTEMFRRQTMTSLCHSTLSSSSFTHHLPPSSLPDAVRLSLQRSTNMAPRQILTKIENKFFSCEFDRNSKGRVIYITESHLNKYYTLLGEEVIIVWLIDSFSSCKPRTPINSSESLSTMGGSFGFKKRQTRDEVFLRSWKCWNRGRKETLLFLLVLT